MSNLIRAASWEAALTHLFQEIGKECVGKSANAIEEILTRRFTLLAVDMTFSRAEIGALPENTRDAIAQREVTAKMAQRLMGRMWKFKMVNKTQQEETETFYLLIPRAEVEQVGTIEVEESYVDVQDE
jgi:hypothetical protein